jgi:hypothetical protein
MQVQATTRRGRISVTAMLEREQVQRLDKIAADEARSRASALRRGLDAGLATLQQRATEAGAR